MTRRFVSRLRTAAVTLLFLMMPVHIAATPERVMTVGDRAFGLGPAHLYVLRVTEDNLGFHGYGLRDVHLVEVALADNAVTRTWPVQRVALDTLSGGPEVRHLEVDGTVEPFEILRDRGAYALIMPTYPPAAAVTLTAEDLTITDSGPHRFGTTAPDLFEAIADGLARTGRSVPDYEGLGAIADMVHGRTEDLLTGRLYRHDDCTARGVEVHRVPGADAPVALVQLACAGDVTSDSLVVAIPAAG